MEETVKLTRRKKQPKLFTRRMQARLLLVFCVVLGMTIVLCCRIAYISFVKGDGYKKRVLSQQSYTSYSLPYKRGSIFDSNGVTLAQSVVVYNVILDPKVMLLDEESTDATIKALYEVFRIDESDITKVLEEHPSSRYRKVLSGQSYADTLRFEKIMDENDLVTGVWFEEEYKRVYPFNTLASHVIGFTNSGNIGTWGVEQYYNSILNGTDGRVYGYYDSELNLQRTVKDAVDGDSIVLTIDANVQNVVQKHVNEFITDVGCKNIGVVVMNPNNAEIIAMVSNQSYDLNNPRDLYAFYTNDEIDEISASGMTGTIQNVIWRNFCISDTFEPGSTFKPITIAGALEENLITQNQEFYCKGYETKGGWQIYCNNRSGHGTLSLTQAVMSSCNCALMAIADIEGGSIFNRYQNFFGFGAQTGIDLPGEAEGILLAADQLNASELATCSFGQSFNVNMIQMMAAYASLINGGNYYKPHVVKEILDSDGNVIESYDSILVKKTVSEETSEFIKQALYSTVEQGTAGRAKVEGYMVGGKTGTAQKLPRTDKTYVVSFMGCVPAYDPEVLIYVVIDEVADETKKNSTYYATTLTSEILEDILPYLGVFPEGDIKYDIIESITTPDDSEINGDALSDF